MDQPRFYSGHFLLALPGMQDARFDRAAIALCSHDEDGALGIAIGQEVEGLGLKELLASFDLAAPDLVDRPVLRGGPMEPRRGFVLHSLDWGGQEVMRVGEKWALSGSLDILQAIAEGRGPSRYQVALGYAGWGAGQLEREMAGDSWFLAGGDADILFDGRAAGRWAAAYAASGVDPVHLVGGLGSA